MTARRSDQGEVASVRTCIGCGQKAPRRELLALVRHGASVSVFAASPRGRAKGRGAHAHPTARCLSRAAQRGLSRSFRGEVRVEQGALLRAAQGALETRRDELFAITEPGPGRFVVLAADASAGAVATATPLVASGHVLVAGSSRTLGARRGVGVELAHLASAARFSELRSTVEGLRSLSEGLS